MTRSIGWALAVAAVLAVSSCDARKHISEQRPLGPPNFFVDPRPPFYIGVASGDPLPDAVILWTRATPRTEAEIANGTEVHWRIWVPPGSSEENPILSGNETADPDRDHTVKVDARPLPVANQTYYYRFYYGFRVGVDVGGERSRLGRTRTAPARDADGGILTFGYTSCTHQGYHLNSLAHTAYGMTLGGEVAPALRVPHNGTEPDESVLLQSEAMTAVLSGGDSLYDYDSGVRLIKRGCQREGQALSETQQNLTFDPAFAPLPLMGEFNCSWYDDVVFYSFTTFPLNIDEWRWRHIHVRLDPDRRAAFAAHPWIHIADSHEGGPQGQSNSSTTSLRAFDWYTPTRVRLEPHPLSGEEQIVLYRDFHFGKLAHLVVLDTRGIGRQQPEDTFMGVPQRRWLREQALVNASASEGWRLMMSGKPVTMWQLNGYDRLAAWITALAFVPGLLGLVGCCWACRVRRHVSRGEMVLVRRGADSSIVQKPGKRGSSSSSDAENAVVSASGGGTDKVNQAAADVKVLALTERQERCLNVCGSKCCVAFGAVCGVGGIVALISFLALVTSISRYMVYEETGSQTVFGEIINFVGSPVDRAEIFKDMIDLGATEDNVWLVGDNHMHQAADVRASDFGHRILPDAAADLIARGRNVFPDYDALESDPARNKLGVEWLPSSTSSWGIHDNLVDLIPDMNIAEPLSRFAAWSLSGFNPHFTHLDPASHGMGYVHVTAERATMQFFRSDIYFPWQPTVLFWEGEVRRGANEWTGMREMRGEWDRLTGGL